MALPQPEAAADLLTIAEGADMFDVRPNTLARWLAEDGITVHHLGPGDDRVRRADLERLLYGPPSPAPPHVPPRPPDRPTGGSRDLLASIEPLTEEEIERALAGLEAAKELQERSFRERGGVPLPPSWPIIREAREDR